MSVHDLAVRRKAQRPKWGQPGSHVTRRTDATVFSRGRRPVIVTIYPTGEIGLRLNRTRREEYVNAADIYRQAVTARVAFERAQRKKKRRTA